MQKALPPATVKSDIIAKSMFYRISIVDNPTCNIRDFYIYERSDAFSIVKRKLATLTSEGVYLFPFGNQITREEINTFLSGLPVASTLAFIAVSLKPGHFLLTAHNSRMFNNLSTPLFIGRDEEKGREIQSLSFEFDPNKKLWLEKVFAFYIMTGRPNNDHILGLVQGLGSDLKEMYPLESAIHLLKNNLEILKRKERENGTCKYHTIAKISVKKNGRLNLDGIHFTSRIAQGKVAGRRKMNVQKESTEILNFNEHQFNKDDEGLVLLVALSTVRICWDYLMEGDSLKLASEIGELEDKILR